MNKDCLTLTFEALECINYAEVVNKTNVITRCDIENVTEEAIKNIKVKISGEEISDSVAVFDNMPKESKVSINTLKIIPDINKLINITEAFDTKYVVSVYVDEEEIIRQEHNITLMAYDQWTGMSIMPELLATFVTPNATLIPRVLVEAAKILEKLSGESALDGYQSGDRNRVRMQVAAIYEALRKEGIVYANPPASFGYAGLRIRMADKVLTEKLGTCLDTTLLLASCLEAAGIHPILIINNNHAYAGAWLDNNYYMLNVGDDLTYLTKRTADGINDIVLIETTCITSSNAVSFDKAVEQANITARDTGDFLAFIDVQKCRLANINPLPTRVKSGDAFTVENQGLEHELATKKVQTLEHMALNLNLDKKNLTKVDIWERKLLDFSLRNNLLNCRLGSKTIPFVSFDIDKLEDMIYDGEDFYINPYPEGKIEPEANGMYDSVKQASKMAEMVKGEISNDRLVSFLKDTELITALKNIYRAAKNSLEENGANTLYLAIGLLKWFENERSVVPRFAPIMLYPVNIVRKGGQNYIIRSREEDMIVNNTLVELLKVQFKIDITTLNQMPKDKSGVDVKLILTTVREAVKNMKGWDVQEEALLGLFSFSKFVMWNDIHSNSDKMKENNVIASLIEGKVKLENDTDTVDARKLDMEKAPQDFAIPIDVDSSQMEAVVESGKGNSFILYGPPGTGKSQTITNMIANALYQGKRVLFVAEKMAALEVVQKRLKKIGLDPFCLELHSNKVTKQHFLQQMKKALETVHIKTPEEYQRTADDLFKNRKRLIHYTEALHKVQPMGLSLYDCIAKYTAIEGKEIEKGLPAVNKITKNDINKWTEEIMSLKTVFLITGHPSQNQLFGLEPKDMSSDTMQKIKAILPKYKNKYEALIEAANSTNNTFGSQIINDDADLTWINKLYDIIKDTPVINNGILAICNDKTTKDQVVEVIGNGRKRDALKTELEKSAKPEFFNQDTEELKKKWEEISDKWFLTRFFAKKKFMRKFKKLVPKTKFKEVPQLLDKLKEFKLIDKEVNCKIGLLEQPFASINGNGDEKWDKIEKSVNNGSEILKMMNEYGERHKLGFRELNDRLLNIPEELWGKLKKSEITIFKSAYNSLLAMIDELKPVAVIDLPEETYFSSIYNSIDKWVNGLDNVKDWLQWTTRKKEIRDQGLVAAVRFIQHGNSPEETAQAMKKGCYHKLIMDIINKDEDLKMFNGLIFEQVIEKYKEETAKFQELSKKELYCRLAARVPSQTLEAMKNSEIGILNRNISNGGRGTSIRKIIDQIPTLLPKLCPCMLMSPLSVAQFIDLNADKFDLVVFDEASQMPTSEAIGAIARGKALICVGDPKQMPPTSFFNTQQVDEDEAEVDDLESILDECIALSMPSYYLSWHYRSKHESLIAFSNANYYEGKLHTFPSIDDRMSKVTLVQINGTYDKGHTRSNKAEAEAIVKEVIRRLSDKELRKQSIGIVSFSKVQQNLIEDILIDELGKNPELENLAFNCLEPIFIKNLENVQGDERDIILFSVGYGPDKDGKVSMNFGPLNNAGGERRLNVAVSRARYEMMVFSTIKAQQIDLKRTQAKGVEGLKNFLEFAASGKLAMPVVNMENEDEDSNRNTIPQIIADELKAKGYNAEIMVGRSNFKIDVAVQNPDNKDEYLLGILCDGKNFYETKTIRDREIVQPGVLKRLYWNVFRVWTVDWYENKDAVIDKIVEEIEKAKKNAVKHPVTGENEDGPQTTSTANDAPKKTEKKEDNSIKEETPEEKLIKGEEVVVASNPFQQQYKRAELKEYKMTSPYTDYRSTHAITKILKLIIETEQPVTDKYLFRKVAECAGMTKASKVVNRAVEPLLMNYYEDTSADKSIRTFWMNKKSSENYNFYRDYSGRDITEIPMIEVMNAIKYAIEQQFSLPKDDLQKSITKMFGFPRRSSKTTEVVEKALNNLIGKGIIKVSGDKVMLADKE